MVVRALDFVGIVIAPTKTDAPLIVDANAELTFAIALQGLKPIAGRGLQVNQPVALLSMRNFRRATIWSWIDILFTDWPLHMRSAFR